MATSLEEEGHYHQEINQGPKPPINTRDFEVNLLCQTMHGSPSLVKRDVDFKWLAL